MDVALHCGVTPGKHSMDSCPRDPMSVADFKTDSKGQGHQRVSFFLLC